MTSAQLQEQEQEQERLRTLHDHELLDTLPEGRFDGLVALAATFLDLPVAFFSLVDGDRIWFKAKYGSKAEQIDRDLSFCALSVQLQDVLVVGDAARDERFANSPLVTCEPHVRFYAGVPVHAANGHVLGTLCVLGTKPRAVTSEELDVLKGLAREIEAQVELRQLLREQQVLFDERAILTDMIVHDASGVVAALRWTLEQLEEGTGETAPLLAQCNEAVDELMRLCEAVLRRNEGESRMLPINAVPARLGPWFEALGRRASNLARDKGIRIQLVNELSDSPIGCDINLLERIVMNLLKNAIQACGEGSNIVLAARLVADPPQLEFVVSDDGPGIPEELTERVFEPYYSARRGGSSGNGLGLTLCRLGARSLGGTIGFSSNAGGGAEFVVRVPAAPAKRLTAI